MKTLQSMELSKKEMKEVKGAYWQLGSVNTKAWGDGTNGADTYLDGMYAGHDNPSGTLGGDSWRFFGTSVPQQPPVIRIM
ncbi:MAG: hypothetical protein NTW29_02775 [Bacteroidetes bacterium]|nr:hypothetical protein [Bacteroidota bacterium]